MAVVRVVVYFQVRAGESDAIAIARTDPACWECLKDHDALMDYLYDVCCMVWLADLPLMPGRKEGSQDTNMC